MPEYWMEELAAAEKWKSTRKDGPSQPQIRVLARALPAFEQQHGPNQFAVRDLAAFINRKYGSGVYAYEYSERNLTHIRKNRDDAKRAGKQTFEVMNACHSFAARETYKVTSGDNRLIQLLDWQSKKTYHIRSDVISGLKDRARKLGISGVDPDGTAHNVPAIASESVPAAQKLSEPRRPGPSGENRKENPTAKRSAIARMAATAWTIAAGSKDKSVLRNLKFKGYGFSSKEKCVKHIEHLVDAQNGLCAITGIRLQFDGNHDDEELLCSLDRIDSAGNYEAGNLQVVCRFVNRWKNADGNEEFKRLIGLVRSQNAPRARTI